MSECTSGRAKIVLVVALRHCLCFIGSLALVGCGRIGFDKHELGSDVDSGSNTANIDSGTLVPVDAGPIDAEAAPPDAMPPACLVEILLSTSTETLIGGFGTANVPQVSLPFAPASLTGSVGKGSGYSDGYAGSQDFRASNDAEFNQAMAPLMSGSETGVAIGILKFPGAGGAYGGATLSSPVSGKTITMARQIVNSLSLTSGEDGGTDHNASVTWELWGCLPPS